MIVLRILWVVAIATTIAVGAALTYPWFWLLPTVVLATESVLSIRRLSWLDKLFVLLLLPEELYQLFRQAYLVRAAWLSVRRRAWAW